MNEEKNKEASVHKEATGVNELLVAEGILRFLSDKTIKIHTIGEFKVYLLGQADIADQFVQTAEHAGEITGVDIRTSIDLLREWVSKDYKILAEFHNHPRSSTQFYTSQGIPAKYATSPSLSDLASYSGHERSIQNALGQTLYPYMIGAYVEETEEVVFNAFNFMRFPNAVEIAEAALLSNVELGMTSVPRIKARVTSISYSDPRVLINQGVITPVSVTSINAQGRINSFQSPF